MYQLVIRPRFFLLHKRFWSICIVHKSDTPLSDEVVYTLFGVVPVRHPRKNLVSDSNPDLTRLTYYQRIIGARRRFYREIFLPSISTLGLPDPLIYLNEDKKVSYSGHLPMHAEEDEKESAGDTTLDRMKNLEL